MISKQIANQIYNLWLKNIYPTYTEDDYLMIANDLGIKSTNLLTYIRQHKTNNNVVELIVNDLYFAGFNVPSLDELETEDGSWQNDFASQWDPDEYNMW